MNPLYTIFLSKQPNSIDVVLPKSNGGLITFLNPSYIEQLQDKVCLYEQFDFICSDGIFPIKLQKLWKKNNSERISFDMSSLAPKVFEYGIENGKTFYFIGSDEDSIEKFIRQITKAYPKINIVGYHHGYIKNDMEAAAKKVLVTNPDIAIVGMGAPLQDEFLLLLRKCGFKGTGYSCGGFMHQTTNRINYYPKWINKFGLRTPYRLLHETYVWKRLFKYYPKFAFKYSKFLLSI